MKAKTIHLFFLILTGLIISWRELTSTKKIVKEEIVITDWQQVNEVGTTAEASRILLLFLIGVILIFVMNSTWQATPKLSSPNSV